VIEKKFKKEFALKEMSKSKIVDRRSERSIKYERDLLSRLKNEYIDFIQFYSKYAFFFPGL
jgi:hypothetical protein